MSAVLCRRKIHIVDVGSFDNAVLDVVLKLPGIVLHFLRSLFIQRVIGIRILYNKMQFEGEEHIAATLLQIVHEPEPFGDNKHDLM